MHKLYLRKASGMENYAKESIQAYLTALQSAILKGNAAEAKKVSKELEQAAETFMPKSSADKIRDFFVGILFALFVAVLIRTMWWELYTIPSGSMRPTLKEEDYLIVSKTDYGINVPLQEKHFYFDPDLVQRGSIIVFNSANIDVADSDTTYFYLFPGKKQFVKRLIGKPGDTIYFYGGQIYGIDAQGNEINEYRDLGNLEHIPYIRFDGKVETPNAPQNGAFPTAIFHQMNVPVAKLNLNSIGTVNGEILAQRGRAPVSHYSDLWGMKHYAMSRLLTKAQVEKIHPGVNPGEGVLYLELTHHPTLQGATLARDEYNRLRPDLATSVSLIPLQQRHVDAIAEHMTTSRFTVKNGVAYRLGWNPKMYNAYLPRMNDVPDGTYEIQDGKATKMVFPTVPIVGIFTNGVTKELPASHPLLRHDPERVQLLYNLGFEFINQYSPMIKNQPLSPSRYAYFRNNDLYLMAGPVMKKDDPTLVEFVKREKEKQSISTSVNPYFPFIDNGPPTVEEIRKNGILVPEKMYMALGDNHAMSADSRQFGFVPEDNLKGGVSFIFSPPGERFGRAPQPDQPHWTFPNVTVWTAFILIAIGTSIYYRRKLKAPLKF